MDDIRVVDPSNVDRVEPLGGLVERRVFHVDGYRLAHLRVDEGTEWHARNGDVYGWVRDGEGYVESGDDRRNALRAGDFLHVPSDTVHRYVAEPDPLEVLAVVAGGADGAEPTRRDLPTTGVDAEPTVVGPDGLVPTVESPDLVRETPFPDADVLLMRVRAAGGAAAGWHHHGDNVYFGYAVDGPSETEYGPVGDASARIELGECFHVPPGLVHRDTNPTADAHTGIIWLCGGEPWVVNVDRPT